jgi:hypothetical protein
MISRQGMRFAGTPVMLTGASGFIGSATPFAARGCNGVRRLAPAAPI